MAKIFETKTDVLRDELAKKAKSQQSDVRYFFSTGIFASFAGYFSHLLSKDPNYASESSSWLRGRIGGKVVDWAAMIVGVASVVVAGLTYKRKKDTEAELKKLGDEEVVFKGDAIEGLVTSDHVERIIREKAEAAKSRSV